MQTEILNVTGMTCDGCISKITRALKEVSGVSDIKVSLSSGETTVKFDERMASSEKIKSAIKSAGYGVDGTNQKPKGGCCG